MQTSFPVLERRHIFELLLGDRIWQINRDIRAKKFDFLLLPSYCTIAASDAKDGSDGFLGANQTVLERCDEERPGAEAVYSDNRIDWKVWSRILQGPLSRRAWAHQERQLATRIIHFTKSGMLWECKVCIGFERFHTPRLILNQPDPKLTISYIPPCGAWRFLDGNLQRTPLQKKGSCFVRILSDDSFCNRWLETVQNYSCRRLRHNIDKLPALAGLAAAFISVNPGQSYFAGLWQCDIHRSLCWYHISSSNQATLAPSLPERVDRIPSWSWASFDGAVSYEIFLNPNWWVEEDRILKIDSGSKVCCIEESNQFGRVDGGRLSLFGAYADHNECDLNTVHITQDPSQFAAFLQSPTTIHINFDRKPTKQRRLQIRLLRIVQIWPRRDERPRRPPVMMGLVLIPKSSSWERAGVFCAADRLGKKWQTGELLLE
ncbi:hypothetical protein F5883DRAFT_430990 [Diaporthe sp. PMI_573]|nr:hypothetical protein F5883DRAFT_430990 [Diaporthaceae sp. PMI_573]